MKQEIIALLFLGVILLSIGLIASFYAEVKNLTEPIYGYTIEVSRTYPYQNLGLILVVSGIALSTIALYASLKKS
jgi:hypothetical protein